MSTARILVVFLLYAGALAASPQAFFQFLDRIETLQAEFSQRTYRGEVLIEALTGRFELKRPDRFRWVYTEPYRQEIIADGSRIWIYDPDLLQVTVKPLSQALRGSPALILSRGSEALKRHFTVEEHGKWLIFRPLQAQAEFRKVEILFDGTLRKMRFFDHFGQEVEIAFHRLQINLPLPEQRFQFTPPPETDIIEE